MKSSSRHSDVPPELDEFVEAVAILLVEDFLRLRAAEQQKVDEVPEGGDRAAG